MKSAKIIHVKWLDSQSTNGWHTRDEIADALETTHTIGILIHDEHTHIVVAHSYDPHTESYNGVMSIPKTCIESIHTMGRVKV